MSLWILCVHMYCIGLCPFLPIYWLVWQWLPIRTAVAMSSSAEHSAWYSVFPRALYHQPGSFHYQYADQHTKQIHTSNVSNAHCNLSWIPDSRWLRENRNVNVVEDVKRKFLKRTHTANFCFQDLKTLLISEGRNLALCQLLSVHQKIK